MYSGLDIKALLYSVHYTTHTSAVPHMAATADRRLNANARETTK